MLSLTEADLQPGHAAYSRGVPFLFVPLCDRDVITRVKLRTDLWEKCLSGWWAKNIFPFTTDTVAEDAQIHARMFAPALGVAEDPATGSAASALAGYLHDRAPRDGSCRWLIEQGFAMGRPSLIELEADIGAGRIAAVRVGVGSVLMSDGWINVS
jgi:trans-2,3-dihydro-3-hydroxyanthranilate isomerase